MHNTVEGGRKDNDVRCVVVQRLREVFYMVSLHDTLAAVCFANALSSYLTAIVVESLQTLANGGDPWGIFRLRFELVFIRFVYQAAKAIIGFCLSNTKKEEK